MRSCLLLCASGQGTVAREYYSIWGEGFPSSPALPLTERQLGTSQLQALELTVYAFLKTRKHAVATSGSLRQMLADAVSTSVIFTCSSLYVRISLLS